MNNIVKGKRLDCSKDCEGQSCLDPLGYDIIMMAFQYCFVDFWLIGHIYALTIM